MVQADKPDVAIGVAGWSYPDWDGIVYERGVKDRLGYLVPYVDMLEINRTFYKPPLARECAAWAKTVKTAAKPGFFFSAKISQEVTHKGKVDPVLAAAFYEGLAPFREAGLLRHLLAQFSHSFRDSPESRERLLRIDEEFGRIANLVLELRDASWQREDALAWLGALDVTVANLDYPVGAQSFNVPVCAIGKHAYFRLHGRNAAAWFSPDEGRDQKYNYLYSPEELDGVGVRMKKIKAAAMSLTVVTNNHYQGREVVNALQLKAWKTGKKVPVPPPLLMRYPVLKEIADTPVELW